MAAPSSTAPSVDSGDVAGFAKLEGQTFQYFMQKYSIILGRHTGTSKVDFDLSKVGGARDPPVSHHHAGTSKVDFDLSKVGGARDPPVSHHHARIFYDFQHRHFFLEVLGKSGCRVRGIKYLPGSVPVKLSSQDPIVIAGKLFYFLLPTCSIFETFAARNRRHPHSDDYGRSNGENGCSRRFTGELDISKSNGINADPEETHGECDS